MKKLWSKLTKTPLGRTATLLGALFLGSGFLLNFTHQYTMPGPVSAAMPNGNTLEGYDSHAMFEQECTHCHAPIHCVTAERCQDCHMEIAQQRAEAVGLHGLLPGTGRYQSCHVEHQGRDAVISEVALANIDHVSFTDFSLAKHQVDYDGQPLGCESCHTQGRFGPDTVDCVSCHTRNDEPWATEHTDLYGGGCLDCHDGHDKSSDFDHALVFELNGAHETTDCADCHVDHTFAGTASSCADCHESEAKHVEIFGTDCARCHADEAWSPAQLTQHTFALDHGDEGKLECQSCHPNTYYEQSCAECHAVDEMVAIHNAPNEGEIADCATCHPTGEAGEAERLGYVLPGQE